MDSASQRERCVPTLRARDAAATCRYFCDELGFTKDWEHGFEDGLPRFVSVSRDGVGLTVEDLDGNRVRFGKAVGG